MVSNSKAKELIGRLASMPGYPDDKWMREQMGLALQESAHETQAEEILLGLIREPGRRFCPTVGEIVAAVQARRAPGADSHRPDLERYSLSAGAPPRCQRCQDTGAVEIVPASAEGLVRLGWCRCSGALQRRSTEPRYVDDFNAKMEAYEARPKLPPASSWGRPALAVEKILRQWAGLQDPPAEPTARPATRSE